MAVHAFKVDFIVMLPLRGRSAAATLIPEQQGDGKRRLSQIHLSERRYRLYRYRMNDRLD
jgi:hypothetical protein